jgi:uncharacterized protein (TIGR02145 family)
MKYPKSTYVFLIRFFLPVFFVFLFLTATCEKVSVIDTTICPNSDFNEGNFNGWSGCYGKFSTPCTALGFDTGGAHPLHKIIHAPGWYDYNTCNGLLTVFPGNSYVARIGDTMYTGPQFTWNKEADLKYPVTVTSTSYLFIYRYAPVLQTGGHPSNWQPDFRVEVTDSTGTLVDSCGYFYFPAPNSGPAPPGWHLCTNNSNGNVYWKDWTTVGMDLTPYFGQTVYIDFRARGCYYDTHFGYAYVTAFCGYLVVHTSMCEGDSSATLTAPPGFTYFWSNGDTTASIVVPHPITGSAYSCTLTALNGCQVTITDTLTYTVINTDFTHGSACTNTPTQFNDSSYVNQNAVVDWRWNFGDGSPVVTGVADPTHTYTNAGTYNVKLISFSTEGCKDSITKQVVVDTLPIINNSSHREQICSNHGTNIILTTNVTNPLFTWTATASSGTITGFSSMSTPAAGPINQILVNSAMHSDSVTYIITPYKGMCEGPNFTYVVVVFPKPNVNFNPATPSICSNQTTNILLTSGVANTSFSWTATSDSLDVTGYGPGSGSVIAQTLHQPGFSIEYVTYHVVPVANGCPGDTANVVVTINPKPHLVTSPMNQTICSLTSTNIVLVSSCPGTTYTWTSAVITGNISGNSSGSGSPIIQTLTNNLNTQGQVNYTIHPTAGSCIGNDTIFSVFVNPKPNVTTTPLTASLCSNSTTNINLLSDVTGASFTWIATGSSGNVSGFSSGSGSSITQTLINSGPAIEMVTYHIVASANGCSSDTAYFIVTVHPLPVPAIAGSPSVCLNSTTVYGTAAGMSNYSWNVSSGGTIISGGTTNTISVTWTSTGAQTISVNYTDGFGCTAASPTVFNLTVNLLPVPSLVGNANVCIGSSVTYSTDPGMTAYLWAVSAGGTITAGGGPANNTATIHWTVIGPQTVSVNYQAGPGCTAPSPTVLNVIVNPLPVPAITGTNVLCKGSTGVIYTAQAGMINYSWSVSAGGIITAGGTSGDNFATLTWNTAGSQTVSVNYTDGNGCTALAPTLYMITVNPLPTATIAGTTTVCKNAASPLITFTGASSTAPYTFTYNINGGANQNVTTVVGNSVTVAAPTNTVGSFTYNLISVQDGSSTACSQLQSGSAIVTVNPLPTATIAGTIAVCQLAASPLITFTGSSSTPPYTFTYNINGGGNQIVTTVVGNSVTVAAPTNIVGSFTYNLVSVQDGSSTLCSQLQAGSAVVTVNPLPTATISGTTAVCQNSASPLITFTGGSSTPPYTFTYNINGGANHVVTTVVGNSITVASPTNIVGIFNYNLVSVQDASATLCSQTQAGTATVTINPLPVPTISGPASVCLNSSASYFTAAGMSNYIWTVSAGGSITSGTGTNTITILWSTVGAKTITVNYNDANGCTAAVPTSNPVNVNTLPVPSLNGSNITCTNTSITYTTDIGMNNYSWLVSAGGSITAGGGISDSFVTVLWNTSGAQNVSVNYFMSTGCTAAAPTILNVTVKPRPSVTNASNSTQCSNGTTNIVMTASLPGTTFTWTATGSSGNVSGYSNGAGGSIIQTLVNTGFSIETVNYAVTPSLNGCDGVIANYIVTVNPVADVYFNPNGQSFCSGGTTSINILSHVAGATFTWTATGSSGNVSGFGPGSGSLIVQTLINSGPYFENVNYDVFPLANSCAGTDNHVIINMNPTPQVSFTTCNDIITTTDAKPITLKGGIPLGGVYSGTGVNTGIFYPSLAGPGNFSINYSYTNTWGCNANMSQIISVISAIPFNCNNTLTDIRDNQQYPTVKLGTQCWMAMNLNYGNIIASASMQRDNCISEKYCFNDLVANCASYGGLYQWDELMQYDNTAADQGFCPPAWHIPTNNDWNTLFGFYISNGFAGSPLKYTGYSGFNAFLSGTRFNNVNWNFSDFAVMFWTSTMDGSQKAWAHGMNTFNPSVSNYPSSRTHAFNVRCIKD